MSCARMWQQIIPKSQRAFFGGAALSKNDEEWLSQKAQLQHASMVLMKDTFFLAAPHKDNQLTKQIFNARVT